MQYSYEHVCTLPFSELETLLKQGVKPKIEDLIHHEFRGYNTPKPMEYLGIRKFIKGFFPHEGADTWCEGYNISAKQTGLENVWEYKTLAKRFGYYHVVDPQSPDDKYPNSLLFNYAASANNPVYDPSRAIKDYLSQIYPDNHNLFLGKAYLAIGPLRIFVSYFILERLFKTN